VAILSPLWGWFIFRLPTHGLRRGLHSFAATRLDSRARLPYTSRVNIKTPTLPSQIARR
jgi:hypothetical protein